MATRKGGLWNGRSAARREQSDGGGGGMWLRGSRDGPTGGARLCSTVRPFRRGKERVRRR